MLRRVLGLVLAVTTVSACGIGVEDARLERAAIRTPPSTTTAPPTTAAPTSSTTAVPVRDEEAASPAPDGRVTGVEPLAAHTSHAAPWTLEPYIGFGAWLDAFDWSVTFARSPENTVGVEAIDHMAAEGVETVYIQGSRWNSETDIIEPERLQGLIDRAHGHGMAVIAWYLPTLEDPATDLRRMLALAALDVDGLAVDIESRAVSDTAERNRRLLDLSARLDEALGDRALGAIVIDPVVMEDVNPNYWPAFPWAELAPHYDVWLPMSYWTNRRGAWRDAYAYTGVNIARIRERIGLPDAPVHTIGGIGDRTTVDDLRGMVAAAVEQHAIGGSIYDYRTTQQPFWDVLRAFRRNPG